MKQNVISQVEAQADRLNQLAFEIFDHPEVGDETVFASRLLRKELENQGFTVESPVGGLNTSYRATWKNGEGGPNIGFLGEYDALRDQGHACGHHMQSPAAIGAAVALKRVLEGTDIPCTLTVYGTPAEETFGGKIIMAENGCFRELDVALAHHASNRREGRVSSGGMALRSYFVDFHGTPSHAASAPEKGRSAADAMYLAFQGIEYMREHVKDGTRMHYSVLEGTGPSNVVCALAKATFTLRYTADDYLVELDQRFRDIIKGACLMTGTTAEIRPKPIFSAGKKNLVLAQVARENYQFIGITPMEPFVTPGKGSTDVHNVGKLVPTINCYIYYCDSGSHTQGWVDEGKSPKAAACILNSAKLMAAMGWDLITKPEALAAAKEEFANT